MAIRLAWGLREQLRMDSYVSQIKIDGEAKCLEVIMMFIFFAITFVVLHITVMSVRGCALYVVAMMNYC